MQRVATFCVESRTRGVSGCAKIPNDLLGGQAEPKPPGHGTMFSYDE